MLVISLEMRSETSKTTASATKKGYKTPMWDSGAWETSVGRMAPGKRLLVVTFGSRGSCGSVSLFLHRKHFVFFSAEVANALKRSCCNVKRIQSTVWASGWPSVCVRLTAEPGGGQEAYDLFYAWK